jgi:myo-inositol-1(or 4)-monophosphatase
LPQDFESARPAVAPYLRPAATALATCGVVEMVEARTDRRAVRSRSRFSNLPLSRPAFFFVSFAAFGATMLPVNLEVYRDFLLELARQSGEFIRPYFANPALIVEIKSDQTPVTIADKGAEELMRRMIRGRFPDHGILGEEFGPDNTGAEFVWVLDPIDGTRAFAAATPLFGTLIALLHRGKPVLGAIHQPVLGQLVIGDGEQTTLNGRPVRVRNTQRLEDATLLCSDFLSPAQYQNGDAFAVLGRRVKQLRTWGDCYGYLLVATGWADIMCDPVLNPWDIAALIPVVRGAGGVITDWQGRDPVDAKSLVAASPALHAQVIAALNP